MKEKKYKITFSKINKLGIISLIFSLIGVIQYGIICGTIAIIIGIIALITLKKETKNGRKLAILGIAIGATDIVMAVVWTVMYSVK